MRFQFVMLFSLGNCDAYSSWTSGRTTAYPVECTFWSLRYKYIKGLIYIVNN